MYIIRTMCFADAVVCGRGRESEALEVHFADNLMSIKLVTMLVIISEGAIKS